MKVLSFDIGGTKIAWGIVNENGKIISEVEKISTPKTAAEITEFLTSITTQDQYDGFALATAGVVFNNHLQGKPNNLPSGYEKIDFAKIFNAPFIVENDATSALYAERCIGALKGVKHGIMLTLGTDVGFSLICNGQVVRGKTGAVGEYRFDFSGRSLQRLAKENNLMETDCFKIYEMVQKGDKIARKVYNIWEETMLDTMSMLNRMLDTEVFVLSGSLSAIVDYAKINTALKLLEPHNPPLIKQAKCGNNAGLIGAALLFYNQIRR